MNGFLKSFGFSFPMTIRSSKCMHASQIRSKTDLPLIFERHFSDPNRSLFPPIRMNAEMGIFLE